MSRAEKTSDHSVLLVRVIAEWSTAADRVVAAFKEHGDVIWSWLSDDAGGQARPSAAH